MATLKKRRGKWYARVQWYKQGSMNQTERQIPLRTESKVTARERLMTINKVEKDIKSGMNFTFPWLSDSLSTVIKQLTIVDAAKKWLDERKRESIKENTILTNRYGIKYFIDCVGDNKPLRNINNNHIYIFVHYLQEIGHCNTTINIHLRTIKTMFNHFKKIGILSEIPVLDQLSVSKKEPIYVTDEEFQKVWDLSSLDTFYKRVFLLYRETGMRLREPMIASLNGTWIDIPLEAKSNSARSIEIEESIGKMFIELKEWLENGYGSSIKDPCAHLSKRFKKVLNSCGVDDSKHFHSLRHTFAVRRLIQGVPIYDVKLMMGHASVTTTEVYSNMNLRRVSQDFPSLVDKKGIKDTHLKDTTPLMSSHLIIY
ncbi:tyrosine-type recombinase/integrase [Candidatus Marinimicrobia bacterium]|nr:tyrosine-type recombinase/integrase [Candidatus Neomarinimicrobiota bacterium]